MLMNNNNLVPADGVNVILLFVEVFMVRFDAAEIAFVLTTPPLDVNTKYSPQLAADESTIYNTPL